MLIVFSCAVGELASGKSLSKFVGFAVIDRNEVFVNKREYSPLIFSSKA
jgi:hypothetical protein